MTDRITPIFPHLSPRADKPSKASRIIRVVLTLAAILFFVYYELRFYYITNIAPPAYMSTLKEFEGSYNYSCDDRFDKQGFALIPRPFLLPVITVPPGSLSISMQLQPPDGVFQPDAFWIEPFFAPPPKPGYFYYESYKQIRMVYDYGGQFTVIPIRWNRTKFLVKPEDVDTLCQETLPNCYYMKSMGHIKGEPTYLDGAPLCQE